MKRKWKTSVSDKIFLFIVYLFLFITVLAVLYPLIYVISCSFSDPKDLVGGKVFFLPVNPGLQGYVAVFKDSRIWSGYGNTILYTVVGTVISTAVTFIGSFVLCRKEFPLRNFMMLIFTITMFFNGGTIPMYLLLDRMNMLDTIWAIVLPGSFGVWLAIVGRTFLQSTIPEELFEATSLDGGGYITFLCKIVLPLSKPILVVIMLNFALGHWNSYYSALLYLNDSDKFPLQLILRDILFSNQMNMEKLTAGSVISNMNKQYLSELLKYSLIIVSSLPLLAIYPFLQKYLIKGTMVGSIKG